MPKTAISVTLEARNLTWLKGKAGATGESVSKLLDGLITAAREGGAGPARSVVGTIDVDPADPELEAADEAIQSLFERSVSRPLVVRDPRRPYGGKTPRGPKRRG